MGTKTISITDEVYERLKALKGPSESFSDELRRLTSRRSIWDFAGAWNLVSDAEAKKIKGNIKALRKGTRLKDVV